MKPATQTKPTTATTKVQGKKWFDFMSILNVYCNELRRWMGEIVKGESLEDRESESKVKEDEDKDKKYWFN